MNTCLSCGQETEGSISAAGNYWKRLCPTCRDSEDAALSLQLKAQAKGFRFIINSLGLGEKSYETKH